MSLILGSGNPLNSFSITPGATVRHSWWWTEAPPVEAHGFAIMPSLASSANRVVSFNHAVELNHRELPFGVFTVDIRCEDTTQSGAFGAYRVIVGQLK
jgi:hypothetical protein